MKDEIMKTFSIELDKATFVITKEISNNTCKAIINTMRALKKKEDRGYTAQEIMNEAVDSGRWVTEQKRDKFKTTWAYYLKKLKDHANVVEVGSVGNDLDVENFLEEDEEDNTEE